MQKAFHPLDNMNYMCQERRKKKPFTSNEDCVDEPAVAIDEQKEKK